MVISPSAWTDIYFFNLLCIKRALISCFCSSSNTSTNNLFCVVINTMLIAIKQTCLLLWRPGKRNSTLSSFECCGLRRKRQSTTSATIPWCGELHTITFYGLYVGGAKSSMMNTGQWMLPCHIVIPHNVVMSGQLDSRSRFISLSNVIQLHLLYSFLSTFWSKCWELYRTRWRTICYSSQDLCLWT